MDLALSCKVNRQGQRNRAIHNPRLFILCNVLLQNMNISSHCTIGKHAYGTCLNGYAHFSSLFLCAINVAFLAIRKANYELYNIYPVSMFCYIKTSFVGSKIAVMQA